MTNPFAVFTDVFSPEKSRALSGEQLSVVLDRSRIRHLAQEAITARFRQAYPVETNRTAASTLQYGAEAAVARAHQETVATVTNISAAAGKASVGPEQTGLGTVDELTALARQLAA